MTDQLVTAPQGQAYAAALDLLSDRRLVVLTGAGLSTDSGIPDYRGPGSTARMPMTYSEFVGTAAARQRYWARSHVGWSRMRHADPNAGHHALARLDPELLITQNVDGLHEAAGSGRVVALHGRIDEVVCLACGTTLPRAELHARLDALNPGWLTAHADVESRPDGDVELDDTGDFVVPDCPHCGGVLKPHVVFFGENAPKEKVLRCYEAVDALTHPDSGHTGALLVAGSSLTVMSGLRFVKRAARNGTPVVIVNRGTTRGDDLAALTVHAGTSDFLTDLAGRRGR
ncbi:NAD-dependent protein deacetylase [Nocardioides daphniae]|uniref:protein acetyllysine N-acetyltransferase n=1 Tax=Nocardioides daphniae TaxID=402297 RepID=A0A4P7UE34_9ACTN|nr:NAD-dependent protein deacetylase [Nocardioides daphniae]QCC78134.1 NAD-dependent protein deacetylase [Nocardioides daphniae]GGD21578.1 NAD-dependent protein deacetylase [Nocardioides daphniae]